MEKEFDVELTIRGHTVLIKGKAREVRNVESLLNDLQSLYRAGSKIEISQIEHAIKLIKEGRRAYLKEAFLHEVFTTRTNRKITPCTKGQLEYVNSMRANDITFCIGPAGTGKTYLAVAVAMDYLKKKEFNKVVLVRPAVEAGESLGYLPGNILDKVDPYFRPLYDAIYDMIDPARAQNLIELGVIEIAPLAYMRGRTLNNAFLIMDEAQNTTSKQMKMFLTRLGQGSKAVITGDITQVDLPDFKKSGLFTVKEIIGGIKGVKFVELTSEDVVRHKLVQEIITAYSKFESKKAL